MILYGDAGATIPLRHLLTALSDCLALPASTDTTRQALILCGMIEQAAADAASAADAATSANAAARLPALVEIMIGVLTRGLADALFAGLPRPTARVVMPFFSSPLIDQPLPVKLPEGFAHYALYPEQYADAARAWAADQPVRRPVIVVGLRSIGTTLAAVVASVLTADGWDVTAVHVRPRGEPFARTVDPALLPTIPPDAAALVVDEGPGYSGSSLAAAAAALQQRGVDPARIAFLPGHAHDPGGLGSGDVAAWWARVRRYPAADHPVRIDGQPLMDYLRTLTGAVRVDDLGGGQWRGVVNAPDALAFPQFEAPKYRCERANGTAVLAKFTGLVTLPTHPRPVNAPHGWHTRPWIAGRPLTRADLDAAVIGAIARHIRERLWPSPPPGAADRLTELLRVNGRELLPDLPAAALPVVQPGAADEPGYGDGRLAPWEWIRADDGTLHKVDADGHQHDHTAIGEQAWLWDLAGAIGEWDMTSEQAAALIAAIGLPVAADRLWGYRAAYLAFRAGMAHSGGVAAPYRDQLRRLLSQRGQAQSAAL